ncbi:hypothetical protein Taro_012502 [Colocasia esculenta]|uniref:C-CAP/cofactor C-like domain-containing protein n=1 Tax=Colocasia esculenta TaxID=4460 RepID=A0A843U8W9_COLES|nr:hypothetical protein [Colocasia esculenta]
MEEDEPLPMASDQRPLSSSKALDPAAAQRKHAAMLERLSNRTSKPSAAASTTAAPPPFESVQSFVDRFSGSRRSLEADIERCRLHHQQRQGPLGTEPKQDLERMSAAIADMEKLVAENSYFLPSYEVRTALRSISDLKESVERASAELLPRKRFAFRNKIAEKRDPVDSVARKVEDVRVSDEGTRDVHAISSDRLTLPVQDSPGFRNKEGAVLVKDFRVSEEGMRGGQGEFSLCDLDSCQVHLTGKCRALFIHRLKNCRVCAGPILGSILIEEVENCVFMLASHQIRIHQARATDFYLRVRSRPIIEDSSGVRFAPYMLNYEGLVGELRDSGLEEETGNWANVDDFRWLRAVQSPNWCVLPEEERLCTIDISESFVNRGSWVRAGFPYCSSIIHIILGWGIEFKI